LGEAFRFSYGNSRVGRHLTKAERARQALTDGGITISSAFIRSSARHRVDTPHRKFQDRWVPLAGQGTLGASYLPCCVARLARGGGAADARARLALLWSERAAALRFRRSVISMSAETTESRLVLARLQREAFAYEAGAARLGGIRGTRVPWLVRLLRGRGGDRVVGATLATMSSELAVLHLATRLQRVPPSEPGDALEHRDDRRSRPA
jgi:hypothetical protein